MRAGTKQTTELQDGRIDGTDRVGESLVLEGELMMKGLKTIPWIVQIDQWS